MAKRKGNRLEQQQEQRRTLSAGDHVWAYLRHSPGDKQTIDSQRSAVREWCAQNGWVLDHEFIDEGVEGSKEQREHFQEMIALARQTPRSVAGIVVWSFSRFARDLNDAQYYKALLRKLGYVIASKSDDIAEGPMAPLMEVFIDLNNQHFLDALSADVKRGLSYLVERGYWPGAPAPFGYRFEREEMGRRRNGQIRYGIRLVKDEALSDRVALAWQMKLQDNSSYAVIHEATRLFSNKHNYGHFFDNMIYTGVFDYHGKYFPVDWEKGGHFCEPYVTLEEFHKVQNNRQRRTIDVIAPRSLSSKYLLTGLLHCAYCESQGKPSSMSGGTHLQTENRFYRCLSRSSARNPDCQMPHIACWKIDDVVLDTLREMVLTPDYVQSEVEKANTKLAARGNDIHLRLRQAEREVSQHEKSVQSLIKLVEKKGLTPILEHQYDEANKAYLEATSRLAMLRSESVQTQVKQVAFKDMQRCLTDLLDVLDTGTLRQKQELIRLFVERVDVYDDRLHIRFRFGLDSLMKLPVFERLTASESYGIGSHADQDG